MASPIFVSACLLGLPVRWDGKAVSGDYASILTKFVSRGGRIVSLCPECSGGLPTPRPPCEIQAGDGSDVLSGKARVISIKGTDQTLAYLQGAREALALCLQNQVKVAVLKSFSPACGNGKIYDGFFRGTKKTASALQPPFSASQAYVSSMKSTPWRLSRSRSRNLPASPAAAAESRHFQSREETLLRLYL